VFVHKSKAGNPCPPGLDISIPEAHANPIYRSLCREISSHEETIRVLQSYSAEKENLVRALREQCQRSLAEQEARWVQELADREGRWLRELTDQRAEAERWRRAVDELQSGLAWKFSLMLSRCCCTVAPPATYRGRLFHAVKRALLVWREAGFWGAVTRALRKPWRTSIELRT